MLKKIAACGDGSDEERAAIHFSIPFQKIQCPADLYSVPCLLHHDFKMAIPDFLECNALKLEELDERDKKPETLERALTEKETFEVCVKELSYYKSATFMKASKTKD